MQRIARLRCASRKHAQDLGAVHAHEERDVACNPGDVIPRLDPGLHEVRVAVGTQGDRDWQRWDTRTPRPQIQELRATASYRLAQQQRAAALTALGWGRAAVAREVGVGQKTVTRWRKLPKFK